MAHLLFKKLSDDERKNYYKAADWLGKVPGNFKTTRKEFSETDGILGPEEDFANNGKIFSVTFFPNISNRDLFTKENVKNYWGNTCLEKKEQINNKEFIDNIYFLDCGEGRRVYLNNLKEISSLLLVF